jgi:hypothetical protein
MVVPIISTLEYVDDYKLFGSIMGGSVAVLEAEDEGDGVKQVKNLKGLE